MLRRAEQARSDVWLADWEHPSLKRMNQFCTGRIPVYVHSSLYSSIKLACPLDVDGVSRNGRLTTVVTRSLGIDGLPYEIYLRLSYIFMPILTDVFNHWFAQGAIPGLDTKSEIILLKKGNGHSRKGLDDFKP